MSDQAKYIYLPVNFPLLPPAVYSSSSSSPRERANLRRIRNQVRKKHIGMNICAHGDNTHTKHLYQLYTYQTIRRQVSRHQGAEMRHVLHEQLFQQKKHRIRACMGNNVDVTASTRMHQLLCLTNVACAAVNVQVYAVVYGCMSAFLCACTSP